MSSDNTVTTRPRGSNLNALVSTRNSPAKIIRQRDGRTTKNEPRNNIALLPLNNERSGSKPHRAWMYTHRYKGRDEHRALGASALHSVKPWHFEMLITDAELSRPSVLRHAFLGRTLRGAGRASFPQGAPQAPPTTSCSSRKGWLAAGGPAGASRAPSAAC